MFLEIKAQMMLMARKIDIYATLSQIGLTAPSVNFYF
jgi:hypothetical protein